MGFPKCRHTRRRLVIFLSGVMGLGLPPGSWAVARDTPSRHVNIASSVEGPIAFATWQVMGTLGTLHNDSLVNSALPEASPVVFLVTGLALIAIGWRRKE